MKLKAIDRGSLLLNDTIDFLLKDPIKNNLPLRIILRWKNDISSYPDMEVKAITEKNQIISILWHSGGSLPVGISNLSENLPPKCVDFFEKHFKTTPTIVAPSEGLIYLTKELKTRGFEKYHEITMRGFKLEDLKAPQLKPHEKIRKAYENDIPLLTQWYANFVWECRLSDNPISEEEAKSKIIDFVKKNSLHILEVDKKVSAVCNLSESFLNDNKILMSQISLVYTPQEERRKGYAMKLVGHSCHHQLDKYPDSPIFLFADTQNPASNKAYENIGFRPHFGVIEMRLKQ